jgi:hypothetical protein
MLGWEGVELTPNFRDGKIGQLCRVTSPRAFFGDENLAFSDEVKLLNNLDSFI